MPKARKEPLPVKSCVDDTPTERPVKRARAVKVVGLKNVKVEIDPCPSMPPFVDAVDELAGGPFPDYTFPLPEHCEEARDGLARLHSYDISSGGRKAGLEIAEPRVPGAVMDYNHSQQTVLDSLVRTILSQNTTDKTSLRAFTKLKATLPTWEDVLAAPAAVVEDAIREGGLSEMKTQRIKAILEAVRAEAVDGPGAALSLEYVRALPTEAVKAELGRFKGVGPKTISCVLMFTLKRAEFPVDTHVWRISKRLGWAPATCSREQCYEHLNRRLPPHLKYDLHVLLVDHGKRCPSCLGKNGRLQKECHGPCPLVVLGRKGPSPVKAEVR